MNLLPFLLVWLIHDLLVKKKALIESLLIRPNVLLVRYSLRLRLNFQLLLKWNLMTSGNWMQQCSRSPVSWIHYHLLSSNNVQTYCYLLLLTSSTSLFVKAACLRIYWNLQYCHLFSRNLMGLFTIQELYIYVEFESAIKDYWEECCSSVKQLSDEQ